MNAAIVSIGHEILTGHTVNTNATVIAGNLLSIGINVRKVITIEDEPSHIISEIGSLFREVDVIISTGGLGPTKDDLTKKAVARILQVPLVKDEKLAQDIEIRYRSIGYSKIPQGGMTQAFIPRGAAVFRNPVGSAPCLLMKKDGTFLFLLPGAGGMHG